VIIVEVMGRHAGWIATYSGMAGGADVVPRARSGRSTSTRSAELLKQPPLEGRHVLDRRGRRGRDPKDGDVWSQHGGTDDRSGHARLGGIAVELEREIEERTGFESRMTILGHVQRGGTPVAYDRVLGTRFGVAADRRGSDGDFGQMVALRGPQIVRVPLDEALAEPKLLERDYQRPGVSCLGRLPCAGRKRLQGRPGLMRRVARICCVVGPAGAGVGSGSA
jgi:6-phosphofructokinase 1